MAHIILKTHYDGFPDPEEPVIAYCGTIADELLGSDKWNEVTCKKCLGLKNKAIKERQIIEEDIVKQMGDMADFNTQYNHHQEALLWWNTLSPEEKRNYEYNTYGDGEYWEDNTLCTADIVEMYEKYKLICVLCGRKWLKFKNLCECGGFCTWGYKLNQPLSFTVDNNGNWLLNI